MAYNNQSRSSYDNKSNSKKDTKANPMVLLDTATRHLVTLEKEFTVAASWNPSLSFAKESVFAKNVINNNSYLTELAVQNPQSFGTAFLQLATSGLSLDPALKLAYLVPRMGRVFLDVSYIGLSRLATDEGLCQDIVVELVFTDDSFKSNGRRQSPEHSFDPFADKGPLLLTPEEEKAYTGERPRGVFRGVYVDYQMKDGRNLVYFLTRQELAAARSVSDSWKKTEKRAQSPWTTFPWQMVRKSAIKQTIHQIPGNRTRVATIIDYLNKDGGEGFRDTNATPLQSAQYEMSARQAAANHDVQPENSEQQPVSSGNVYEGQVVTPEPQQTQTDVQHKPASQASEEPQPPHAAQNSESTDGAQAMSDIPGVRVYAQRRIAKIIKRASIQMAFETSISVIKTEFEFNETEIAYGLRLIEESRRNILQAKLILGIENNDYSELDKFLGKLAVCEFKTKSLEFTQEIRAIADDLHALYEAAKETNNFTAFYSTLETVTFNPLRKYWDGIIASEKAA
ncbi:recombinase RecT (plasmid) [Providencia huaxiensis]|uniref:DNA recombinase n=7 Tax=Enterobacterales TaxID=91347 RepID=A0A7L8KA36_ECOLX|nr:MULTISPECIES: recombinase RecT [Enterobacterales]ELB1214841.1 recombinase RecT [Proteus mirabilis]ELY4881483.1 recombinase RecT [Morganella morganii]SPY66604.1 recombination and repair protein RecT [Providencia stuartii]ELR5094282.1 recombinase RecT [Providencia rettgeri]ELR5243130.1 recombinase RecT [Providencia rettgeri]